jgi:hypothetical protein
LELVLELVLFIALAPPPSIHFPDQGPRSSFIELDGHDRAGARNSSTKLLSILRKREELAGTRAPTSRKNSRRNTRQNPNSAKFKKLEPEEESTSLSAGFRRRLFGILGERGRTGT